MERPPRRRAPTGWRPARGPGRYRRPPPPRPGAPPLARSGRGPSRPPRWPATAKCSARPPPDRGGAPVRAPPPATPPLPPRQLDDLVGTHLPLVGHLVRELLGRVPAHVSRDDLVSAGMAALATAAKGYDPA